LWIIPPFRCCHLIYSCPHSRLVGPFGFAYGPDKEKRAKILVPRITREEQAAMEEPEDNKVAAAVPALENPMPKKKQVSSIGGPTSAFSLPENAGGGICRNT
jgi:hypothetical protein